MKDILCNFLVGTLQYFQKHYKKKLKKTPSKNYSKILNLFSSILPWAALKEQFMFQNVAYRPTVNKTGVGTFMIDLSSILHWLHTKCFILGSSWVSCKSILKSSRMNGLDQQKSPEKKVSTYNKVQIFWYGHKILQDLLLRFDVYYVQSNQRGWFRKILWPSHITSTLATKLQMQSLVFGQMFAKKRENILLSGALFQMKE